MTFLIRAFSGAKKLEDVELEQLRKDIAFQKAEFSSALLNSATTRSLVEMIFGTSHVESQLFLKSPSKQLLCSNKELVWRILSGLPSQDHPLIVRLQDVVQRHGVEAASDIVLDLLKFFSEQLLSSKASDWESSLVQKLEYGWHIESPLSSKSKQRSRDSYPDWNSIETGSHLLQAGRDVRDESSGSDMKVELPSVFPAPRVLGRVRRASFSASASDDPAAASSGRLHSRRSSCTSLYSTDSDDEDSLSSSGRVSLLVAVSQGSDSTGASLEDLDEGNYQEGNHQVQGSTGSTVGTSVDGQDVKGSSSNYRVPGKRGERMPEQQDAEPLTEDKLPISSSVILASKYPGAEFYTPEMWTYSAERDSATSEEDLHLGNEYLLEDQISPDNAVEAEADIPEDVKVMVATSVSNAYVSVSVFPVVDRSSQVGRVDGEASSSGALQTLVDEREVNSASLGSADSQDTAARNFDTSEQPGTNVGAIREVDAAEDKYEQPGIQVEDCGMRDGSEQQLTAASSSEVTGDLSTERPGIVCIEADRGEGEQSASSDDGLAEEATTAPVTLEVACGSESDTGKQQVENATERGRGEQQAEQDKSSSIEDKPLEEANCDSNALDVEREREVFRDGMEKPASGPSNEASEPPSSTSDEEETGGETDSPKYELPLEPQNAVEDAAAATAAAAGAAAQFQGKSDEPLPIPHSGLIPLSGPLQYSHSGPIPFSGNLSLRSDSSTNSTRSFAFPILHTDWNSSPVKMAPADRRNLRRRHGLRWRLLCCFPCAKSSTGCC